ncbi:unnamed protein product [Dracunculus medinensis]|uniref:Uncharacterized protein n=1 Tax=Dracunculus medinensis TaxID=318479 RepID=A0A0N4UMR5_DRAME|nr:unnamed protein product [Dracunculus medinensis]
MVILYYNHVMNCFKFDTTNAQVPTIYVHRRKSIHINDNEIAKWNLYYDEYEKLWKSISRLENSELSENSNTMKYMETIQNKRKDGKVRTATIELPNDKALKR